MFEIIFAKILIALGSFTLLAILTAIGTIAYFSLEAWWHES